MSAQQTSYALEQTATGFQGDLVDTRNILVDAFRNDLAASAEAAFGLGVCRSTNTDLRGFGLCIATKQFLGVLVHSMRNEKTTTGLPNAEFGDVCRKGRVWVKTVGAVTPEAPVRVYIVDDTGTLANTVQGAFGTAAVTGKTALLTNARYLTSGAAGDIVMVELDAQPVLLVAD